ncbi:hypothetical protein [Paenibacillus xylaniclasticus]|uniref:hypothetical protein n=1 Tax=Paenibacillus xylaniclasticus TaxID=588083 RepID=UPI000FD9D030|nr:MULTISPECIES: hypothetical protein [Paenibacillus]GFN33790.1 hypothetical protein PCURB6_40500 [Paenibacillus curdlanolyticus]
MALRSKLIVGAVVSSLFLGALSVSAYSGKYSFTISYSIKGKTEHSLDNKSTSTDVTAQSYDYDYSSGYEGQKISSNKDNFTVSIIKGLFTEYSVSGIKADGNSYSKNFGVVSKGDYVVKVTKNGGGSDFIDGIGYIKQ